MEKRPGQQGAHPEAAEASADIVNALLTVDAVTDHPFANGAPILAAAGLFVFPLDPRDKKPLVKWGTKATTDQETIAQWGRRCPDAGIGIACKPSGLLLVDLDVKHPPISGPDNWAELTLASGDPEALWGCLYDRTTLIKSSSGGYHLWYANPEGIPGRDNMLPGIDVKAAQGDCGGFVVAPPTPGYEVLGLKPPMPVPGWLALILLHDDKPHRARWQSDTYSLPGGGDAGRRFSGLINNVLKAVEGERSARLFWSACRAAEMVQEGVLTHRQVSDALTEAAQHVGLGYREAEATIRSAFRTTGGA
ncbi:bifunctional DNA primase/polymerase [Streptomyces smyrnaeus]|uniref:bifunctional DNA primase/polymerase n=1 Tax=Streptomyces smyrnaeus TaxID=1387713 RepID=UPI0037AD401B